MFITLLEYQTWFRVWKIQINLENTNDVEKLSRNDYESIEVAYNYGMAGLNRVQAKFTTLDTKASHTMGIIAVVVAILVLSFPASTERSEEIRTLLFTSIIFFLRATLDFLEFKMWFASY